MEKYPEAEVVIRLMNYLVENNYVNSNYEITVNLDGSSITWGEKQIFGDVIKFLNSLGWQFKEPSGKWRGKYEKVKDKENYTALFRSKSGEGDLRCKLKGGKELYVECKKGEISSTKSSAEYKLIREAIGQIATIEKLDENYIYAVCVPENEKTKNLIEQWELSEGVKRLGIKLFCIDKKGKLANFKI